MAENNDDQLLDDYITCRFKAYLRLAEREVESNELHDWHLDRTVEYKAVSYERLKEISQLQCDSTFIPNSGAVGIYPEVRVAFGCLDLGIDAVQVDRRDSKTTFPDLTPIAFHYQEKITKKERLQIVVKGIALERQTRSPVQKAKIIHGRGFSSISFPLTTIALQAENVLNELDCVKRQATPPEHALNSNCQACVYFRHCRDQAVERDCLTLLPRLSLREIGRLKANGITTLTQYSYTYRPPQRRSRRTNSKRNLALQAMALRTGKIYVIREGLAPLVKVGLYLDVECDPDKDFYYLVGVLDTTVTPHVFNQFWVNEEAEESEIWFQLLSLASKRKSCPIYHYGDFERKYIRRMEKLYGGEEAEIGQLQSNLINVLSSIYSNVYFPVYSNSLKEIAAHLGFQWTEKGSGGANSVVWRQRWERDGATDEKRRLLTYNHEDCSALRLVVSAIELLADGSTQGAVDVDSLVPGPSRQYGKVDFVLPDLEPIPKDVESDESVVIHYRAPVQQHARFAGGLPFVPTIRGCAARAAR